MNFVNDSGIVDSFHKNNQNEQYGQSMSSFLQLEVLLVEQTSEDLSRKKQYDPEYPLAPHTPPTTLPSYETVKMGNSSIPAYLELLLCFRMSSNSFQQQCNMFLRGIYRLISVINLIQIWCFWKYSIEDFWDLRCRYVSPPSFHSTL